MRLQISSFNISELTITDDIQKNQFSGQIIQQKNNLKLHANKHTTTAAYTTIDTTTKYLVLNKKNVQNSMDTEEKIR